MANKFSASCAGLQSVIRKRAADLYLQSGKVPGHDVENWKRAEAEILREIGNQGPRPAVVINVDGIVYTGEYDGSAAGGYTPGEWKPGDRIAVRLEGDKLFLRRPNGRELVTSIVKRIG
jgi:hypothetical protein